MFSPSSTLVSGVEGIKVIMHKAAKNVAVHFIKETIIILEKNKKNLPKCIQVTRGGGEPLTLQSKRAARPSMTSRMSSLRVKRGSTEGVTLRLALDVSSSVEYNTHSPISAL